MAAPLQRFFQKLLPPKTRPPACLESKRESRCRSPHATAGFASPAVRVLVVDDNAEIAETITALLRALGHRAYGCSTAQECLRALEEFAPDVVLLDICMPDCDGFDLCRQMRQHAAYRGVPVVACSALDPADYQRETRDCGFTDYLVKPVSLPRLAEAVEHAAPLRS